MSLSKFFLEQPHLWQGSSPQHRNKCSSGSNSSGVLSPSPAAPVNTSKSIGNEADGHPSRLTKVHQKGIRVERMKAAARCRMFLRVKKVNLLY